MLSFVFLALLQLVAAGTHIATFTDTKCKDSFRDIDGPNGYPNGTCSRLDSEGSFGSFQVVQQDPGCGVTIYGNDTTEDICSSIPSQTIIAELVKCYNSSWVHYSIDFCTDPSTLSSSTPSSNPTNTATSKSSGSSHPGLIAGCVVGGVIVIAALAIGAFIYARRKRRANGGVGPIMKDGRNIQEMDAGEVKELPAHPGAEEYSELQGSRPRSSVKPPVELPAYEYPSGPK